MPRVPSQLASPLARNKPARSALRSPGCPPDTLASRRRRREIPRVRMARASVAPGKGQAQGNGKKQRQPDPTWLVVRNPEDGTPQDRRFGMTRRASDARGRQRMPLRSGRDFAWPSTCHARSERRRRFAVPPRQRVATSAQGAFFCTTSFTGHAALALAQRNLYFFLPAQKIDARPIPQTPVSGMAQARP